MNFLALLGWSPGDDREIMTLAEMIRAFSLDRVGAVAVGVRSRQAALDELRSTWRPCLPKRSSAAPKPAARRSAIPGSPSPRFPFTGSGRERFRSFSQPSPTTKKIVRGCPQPGRPEEERGRGNSRSPVRSRGTIRRPRLVRKGRARGSAPRGCERKGHRRGKAIHPLRLAATGKTVGAPLFDVLELLGKETVDRRIRNFVAAIGAAAPPAP